ncbi:MAG TPA: diaminopimelate epimerase [Verrucomicrobiales bacterium]|nr:diaminopimelate epimerase [Verrucomicrobiales bacterium]
MIAFTKMNGAGNDFVVIDNRDRRLQLEPQHIARICERHRGVGADGLLLVEPPEGPAAARMRYYNSDGGEAEMCGNGARCFARFVNRLHDNQLPLLRFETLAGVIEASFQGELVRVQLSPPSTPKLGVSLEAGGQSWEVHSVDTGVPHAVVVVNDADAVDLARFGPALRWHSHFSPRGANVNFQQVLAPASLRVRTFERGVEAETLACGTGVVANAIIHHQLTGCPLPVSVAVAGGDSLLVDFTPVASGYDAVTLTGPAAFVFEGSLASLP